MFSKVLGSTKRRIVLAMAVALLLVALPAAAFAAKSGTPFTASGTVWVTNPPKVQAALTPHGVIVNATGEQVSGIIASEGWPEINGAPLTITIKKETSFFDFATGTFSGHLAGNLTINTASGPMTGTLQGTISGAFTDPTDIVNSITTSTAQVKWNLKGSTTRADGVGTATFGYDPACGFCGPITISGSVTSNGKDAEAENSKG